MGGAFAQVPLCGAADQTGCVIGYSSYLESGPPGADARFGADPAPGQEDACVDPAALLGHKALQPAFPATGRTAAVLGTTFAENPGVVLARCARRQRPQLPGHLLRPGGRGPAGPPWAPCRPRRPSWGLHAIDVSLALGDLVEIVGRQSAAWTAGRGR